LLNGINKGPAAVIDSTSRKLLYTYTVSFSSAMLIEIRFLLSSLHPSRVVIPIGSVTDTGRKSGLYSVKLDPPAAFALSVSVLRSS
jgi:hypothetical protein